MLNTYLAATRKLLQNPPAPVPLYSDADLATYINTARGQLAGDAECIRVYGTLTLAIGQRVYPFSGFSLGSSATTGVAGIFKCNTLWYNVGSGQKWFRPRAFEWFSLYLLNNPVPPSGPPKEWAQYGQGVGGSLFINPLPDLAYVCPADTVCHPIDLVDDTTVEAIPYPWTDAVPYFAAYYALLSAQSPARQADADRMMERYQEFKNNARRYSNPSVMPGLYAQAPNPVRQNQLGLVPAKSGDANG